MLTGNNGVLKTVDVVFDIYVLIKFDKEITFALH